MADEGMIAGTVRCETPAGRSLSYQEFVKAVAAGRGYEVIFPEEDSPNRELVVRITTE